MQGTATTTTSTRRKITAVRNGAVSSSVWENRMKMDQVKGGIKVFNDDCDSNGNDSNVDEDGTRVYQRLRRNQSDSIVPGKKKRRNWTPPAETSAGESPIQLRKSRSEISRNSPRLRAMKSLEFSGGKKPVLLLTDGSDKVEDKVGAEMEDDAESFEDKEMDLLMAEDPSNVEEEKTVHEIDEICEDEEPDSQQNSSTTSSVEVKKNQNSATVSPLTVEKIQNPVIVSSVAVEKKLNSTISSSVTVERKKEIPRAPEFHPASEADEQVFPDATHDGRMQTIVDLIMWRDVSRSAFVFGLGTFSLISSSYTNDLDFSLISATSYAGLIYLALIFTYKSILHRVGSCEEYEEQDVRYMVGEEDVVWVIRKLLPYINELLLSLKALFSGDPTTTMKLAVILFVLARCGKSITIWSLIKLVFFGVFTVPKVCSSYSYQLTRYGKFWVDRLRDGWESCSHKKAVAVGIFTIIWNISSTVARIWALFMLVVAFKLYKQCGGEAWANGERQDEVVEDEVKVQNSKPTQHSQGIGLHHRQRVGGAARGGVGQERKVKKWQ